VHSETFPVPLDVADETALEEVAVEFVPDELAIVPAPLGGAPPVLPAPPAPPEELKASPQPLATQTAIEADTSAAAMLVRVLWFMVRLGSFPSTGRHTTRSPRGGAAEKSAGRCGAVPLHRRDMALLATIDPLRVAPSDVDGEASKSAEHGGRAGHRLSSRVRLTPHELHRFQGPTLFDHIARVVCAASCLPRKELYESWEVARRARRRFRGGRVVDLACGHGLVAHMMLLLDDTSETALAADRRVPRSAGILAEAMQREWPRLAGRIEIAARPIAEVTLSSSDVVVSAHACGGLTDEVLGLALAASARVVVLPCCQAEGKGDLGGVGGWVDGALAIDLTRAARLRAHGYTVYTQTIPAAITPKNRLLLGAPPQSEKA